MTRVYYRLDGPNGQITTANNIMLRSSSAENNATSQLTFRLPNQGGLFKDSVDEGNEVSFYADTSPIVSSAWYDSAWLKRTPVTIDYTKVSATQTNFPVYVDLSSMPAGFWSAVQNGGADIRVTTSDSVTECAREVVSCVTASSTGELYFLAPSVSNAANTTFYIYYGNASATEPAVGSTYGRNNVWSDYLAVYHLSSTTDSTGSFDLTNSGASQGAGWDGRATSAYSFASASSNYMIYTGNVQPSSAWTVSAWIKPSSAGNGYTGIALYGNTTNYARWGVSWDSDNDLRVAGGTGPADTKVDAPNSNLTMSAWNSFVVSHASASSLATQVYVAGALTDDITVPDAGYSGANLALNIGRWIGGGATANHFDGVIDEVRISSSVKSSAWVSTEYNNQYSSNTFYAIGTEETETIGSKIFVGIVTSKKYSGKGSHEQIDITTRDYTALLQKITVEPEVYTNQEISAIVSDLMLKYGPSSITTTGVVSTGKTLARIAFKQVSLFDAIKQLADLAGFYFLVDPLKDLKFTAKGGVSTGVILDTTNVLSSEFTVDVDSVKNNVYVYGAKAGVAHPRETFTGDGAGSVFTLASYPHATDVYVSGAQQKGDIYMGTNVVTSGAQYLVNYNDKKIIFVSGTAIGYSSIPGSLVAVAVDYQISKPIAKHAEDLASEQAYGKRTEVIVDQNILDPQTAQDVAKNKVALQKDPLVQGVLSIVGVASLTPGYTVLVNLPYKNQANQTHSVIEVNYTFNPETAISGTVLKVKVARRLADVTDILKNLLDEVNRLKAGQVETSDVITRLITSTGSTSAKVLNYNVKTRTIGHSFILGHPINGLLGSPHLGIDGQQILLGDHRSSQTIIWSGGE